MNSEPEVASATRLTPIAQQAVIDPAGLARGDADALAAFYRDLFEPIYAFVYWRVGGVRQDAEDVTQETFVTALDSIDRFEGRSSLYVWVCGIAKNLSLARVRNRQRTSGEQPGETSTSAEAGPDQMLERAQTDRLVGLALTELPPHYQRALLDKYVQHQSFAEMAAAQRCSAKAVESTVQRAKRALAAALERLGLTRPDGESRSNDHG